MSQKRARKGAFWHVLKIKITSRKPAANGALQIIDVSRASIKAITLFHRTRMYDIDFKNSVTNGDEVVRHNAKL